MLPEPLVSAYGDYSSDTDYYSHRSYRAARKQNVRTDLSINIEVDTDDLHNAAADLKIFEFMPANDEQNSQPVKYKFVVLEGLDSSTNGLVYVEYYSEARRRSRRSSEIVDALFGFDQEAEFTPYAALYLKNSRELPRKFNV